MKHYKKFRRFGSLALAGVVTMLTLSVMVHAVQMITTPNAAFISYSLATSGTSSPPITPVAGQAVLVMGTVTVGTDCGSPSVGEVTLLRAAAGSFSTAELIWTGLESPGSSPSVITSGASATPGTHILYLDTGHRVDLEVNSASTFVVHSTSCGAVKGNVTMIW
jgi:hypothetical protein